MNVDRDGCYVGNAFAEGMFSCPFRSVPAHVPMFTHMGRTPRGRSCIVGGFMFSRRGVASWSCVQPDRQTRRGKQCFLCGRLRRADTRTDEALMRAACGRLCTAGAFMSSWRRISGVKVAALACVRDRREYGFVCGTHRFATLAVSEGGFRVLLGEPCLVRIWPLRP